ncbi:MAG: DUF5320 domain-containing protein [Deltaproteobacteria bacterium]|nr:DUF5320 domain-containing protein [Deltaproteobacteria bacterium]
MPGGNRTGPAGMGPMTGRAAGYCAGYAVPGFANPIPGRGYGLGFGRGMGFGFRGGRGRRWSVPYAGYGYGYGAPYAVPFGAAPTRQEEIAALQEEAKYLENALQDIHKRISDLEIEKSQE